VHTIKASGHVHRSNRPNTRLHPTTTPDHQSTLAMREPSTQDIAWSGLTRMGSGHDGHARLTDGQRCSFIVLRARLVASAT
jgi:hypothetical protein